MKTLLYVKFIVFLLVLVHTTPSLDASAVQKYQFQPGYAREAQQIDEFSQSIRDIFKRGILREETNDEITELRAMGITDLTHSRSFPLLLLPLLATPFVPVIVAPALILTSVVGLFLNQFSDLSHFGQIVDFASNVFPTEHLFVAANSNSTVRLNDASSVTLLIEQIHKRLNTLTSWESLVQIRDHTLRYFGISEPTCQQKMICDTAFAVATRLPPSLSNVARTATGFMFSKINSNAFFRAWIIGLTKDNCTAAYESCKESPFIKILKP